MIHTIEKEKKNFGLLFFECVAACVLMISCDSMYITLAPYDAQLRNVLVVVLIVSAVFMMIFSGGLKNRKRVKTALLYGVIIGAWLLAFILITFFNKGSFLKLAAAFLFLLVYYFIAEGADRVPGVLVRYTYIVTIVAAFSIACWLVFSIFRLIPSSGTELTWWNGTDHYTEVTSFFGIYFEPQTKYMFGEHIARNCGFFTEAPIASLHFCFALLASLFLENKVPRVRTILLLAAVATTFSATGYAVAGAAVVVRFLLYLFRPESFRKRRSGAKAGIIILAVVLAAAVCAAGYLIVQGRVGGESWNIRAEDFRATFAAWRDHPIIGNGIYNFDAVKMHFEGARATAAGFSCSNSLGTILADGGLMFGILYIGAFLLALGRSIRNREPGMFFFSLFVFVIFAVTIVAYDHIIMMMFIFMGAYRCLGARRCRKG